MRHGHRLRRSIGQHCVQMKRAETIRLEHEMTSVRRPCGALIVTRTGSKPAGIGAVGTDSPQVVGALARREDDHVTTWGPAGLGVMSAVGQLSYARAFGIHQEDVRAACPIADERDLLSRR